MNEHDETSLPGPKTTDDDLLTFLEEIADYEQTGEEARAELVEEGVDVDGFLAKVRERVERAKKESGQ